MGNFILNGSERGSGINWGCGILSVVMVVAIRVATIRVVVLNRLWRKQTAMAVGKDCITVAEEVIVVCDSDRDNLYCSNSGNGCKNNSRNSIKVGFEIYVVVAVVVAVEIKSITVTSLVRMAIPYVLGSGSSYKSSNIITELVVITDGSGSDLLYTCARKWNICWHLITHTLTLPT